MTLYFFSLWEKTTTTTGKQISKAHMLKDIKCANKDKISL